MVSSENDNPSTSALRLTCHYRNKYEKWYWMLIQKSEDRISRGQENFSETVEEHHPIPECLYPTDWSHSDRFWKVILTPREHYIAHVLLAKTEITPYIARSITRFLHSPHNHLRLAYTKLRWLGKKIVSKHGYNVPPYRNTATSKSRSAKDLWKLADQAYEIWLEENCGGVKLASKLRVRRSNSLLSMVKKFKEGWVPLKDLDWITFKLDEDIV